MKKRVIETLDLNAEIMALVRERLEAWKESHKEYEEDGTWHMTEGYEEVHCDVKELNTAIIHEMYDYLRSCGSGQLLSKTAKMAEISRATVDRILKK